MLDNRCPNCGSTAVRTIPVASNSTHVSYYRCDVCGHVWTTTRDGARIISHVTPLKLPMNPEPPASD